MKTFAPRLHLFVLSLFNHVHALLFGYMARAGLIAFDVEPEEIAKELKRIGDEVRQMAKSALDEAGKSGKLSTSTKEEVDQLLAKQGEVVTRLADIEQKLAARPGAGAAAKAKTAGEEFTSSEAFKKWKEEGANVRSRLTVHMKAITSLPASAGDGIEPQRVPGVLQIPERRLTVRDLITPGNTTSNLVQYLRETGFTNAAAIVAESARKPESGMAYDLLQAPVVKLAHFVKASTEILDDFEQLQGYIDGRLRYGLKLVEEGQLLNGSGAGGNLNGIYTQATAYVAPIAIAGETKIDRLRLALLQAELAEFPSTGIVLHPSNWAEIELTKDDNGAYIFANPQSLAQPGLWGRPVVPTVAQGINTFLVGAFKLGAQVWDRRQANVSVATENEDDFVNNLVTMLAEERLALTVYRPEAFVKGSLTIA